VLAIELEDSVGGGGGGGGGYSSTAARDVVLRLRARSIQARPLGNVLYLMCAPTTPPERCAELMDAVHRELQEAALGDDEDW
jgi:dethiobiotin synthetase/adenosylmethionine--8-amino-7-oxononanoate aminotransferase